MSLTVARGSVKGGWVAATDVESVVEAAEAVTAPGEQIELPYRWGAGLSSGAAGHASKAPTL
jgi:hypothetical protein